MILLLGASGMLGHALSLEISNFGWPGIFMNRHQLDITNQIGLFKAIKEHRPTVIINAAAMTNVDLCEENEPLANAINADSIAYLADLCFQYRIKFFHIGTDYVFDGTQKRPMTEEDIPTPVQAYGRSKLKGEMAALEHKGYVIRVQAVYGPGRKNTTDWMVTSFKNKQRIPLSLDQIASPCSTFFLSKNIFLLTQKLTTPGLYHLAHDNYASRYQIGQFIARGLNENPDELIQPMIGANFGKAKRPISTILSNHKLGEAIGMKSFGTWEKDITNYIRAVWKFPFYGRNV